MTQADFTIANQTFPNTRTELNTSLQALATNSAGNSSPSTTFPNQWHFDSDGNQLYMRNKDNDAWVEVFSIGATTDKIDTIADNIFIGTSGQLGVGIAPALALHVSSGADNVTARFESTDTEVAIELKDTTGTAIIASRNDFRFTTGGSETMRLDTSGNVGIGILPESGQGSNSQGLYVGTHSSLTSNGAYESVNLSENAYLATASSDTWKYRDTSHAATHEMKAGVHTLKVTASGSADSAITWNTGFEVLNDGKARAKNGLLFGTDTATANALDDYEEGSFTYTIVGSNSGNLTPRSGYTKGEYVKIGNLVHVELRFETDGDNSISGTLRWSLPFTMANTNASDASNAVAPGYIRDNSLNTNARTGVYLVGQEQAFCIYLFSREGAANSTVEVATEATTDGTMEGVISISYRTT